MNWFGHKDLESFVLSFHEAIRTTILRLIEIKIRSEDSFLKIRKRLWTLNLHPFMLQFKKYQLKFKI